MKGYEVDTDLLGEDVTEPNDEVAEPIMLSVTNLLTSTASGVNMSTKISDEGEDSVSDNMTVLSESVVASVCQDERYNPDADMVLVEASDISRYKVAGLNSSVT